MPHASAPTPSLPSPLAAPRALWIVLACVVSLHWLALSGASRWFPRWESNAFSDAFRLTPSFETRMLVPSLPPDSSGTPEARNRQAKAVKPMTTKALGLRPQPPLARPTDLSPATVGPAPFPGSAEIQTTSIDNLAAPVLTPTEVGNHGNGRVDLAAPTSDASALAALRAPLSGSVVAAVAGVDTAVANPSTSPSPATPTSSPPSFAPGASARPSIAATPTVGAPQTAAPAQLHAAPTQAAVNGKSPSAKAPSAFHVPETVRLIFDGKGQEKGFINYYGSAELVWQPNGSQYEASMEISALGIRLVTWTSKGALGPEGLQPRRFGDRRRGPETATHFQREKGIISFSANNPDVPLLTGAQDKLSVLMQLSGLVAGDPKHFLPGTHLEIQAADAHRAEIWDFLIKPLETLELPGGTVKGLPFVKEPNVQYDQKVEAWFAPEMGYLPVRLRITEANGSFSDLLWKRSSKPD